MGLTSFNGSQLAVHAVPQMRVRRGHNASHIQSRGKSNVTRLIKLQSTSFFLYMEHIYKILISVC